MTRTLFYHPVRQEIETRRHHTKMSKASSSSITYDFYMCCKNHSQLRKLLEVFKHFEGDVTLYMTARGLVFHQRDGHHQKAANADFVLSKKQFHPYLIPSLQGSPLAQSATTINTALGNSTTGPTHTALNALVFRVRIKEFIQKLKECREKSAGMLWYKESGCRFPCIKFLKVNAERITVPISLEGIMEVNGRNRTSVPSHSVDSSTEVVPECLPLHISEAYAFYLLQQSHVSSKSHAWEREDLFGLIDENTYPRRLMVGGFPFIDEIRRQANFNEYTQYMCIEGDEFWCHAFGNDDVGAAKTIPWLPRPTEENLNDTQWQTEWKRLIKIAFAVKYLMLMGAAAGVCPWVCLGFNEKKGMLALFLTPEMDGIVKLEIALQQTPRNPPLHLHPFGDVKQVMEGKASVNLNA